MERKVVASARNSITDLESVKKTLVLNWECMRVGEKLAGLESDLTQMEGIIRGRLMRNKEAQTSDDIAAELMPLKWKVVRLWVEIQKPVHVIEELRAGPG